jgi:Tol biopolymer transport system component
MKIFSLLYLCVCLFVASASVYSQPSSDSLKAKPKQAYSWISDRTLPGEVLSTFALSPKKDKLFYIRYDSRFEIAEDDTPAEMEEKYSLWVLDFNIPSATFIAQFNDYSSGINQLSWSPDGKWIAFGTFSIGGHSPMTTGRTFVAEPSGEGLHIVKLPAPYNRFSSGPKKWASDHELVVNGMRNDRINGEWKVTDSLFIYDCETQSTIPVH